MAKGYSLAALDDVIARGRRNDWEMLRAALRDDPSLAEKVRSICEVKIADPYAQRYHFGWHYVGK